MTKTYVTITDAPGLPPFGGEPFSFGVDSGRYVIAPHGRDTWVVHGGGAIRVEATLAFTAAGYELVVTKPTARRMNGASWQALLAQL